jgi:hypothetical protein|tara:strand:- start:15092 stop:16024 length:933 start_codon:yes stop_codon:yes gene_type:complete
MDIGRRDDRMIFDLIQFCEDRSIEYNTAGKNVTEGWINVNCPFCDDPSNHLGYHPKTGKFNCWKCGSHSLFDVLQEWDVRSIKKIIKQYQSGEPEIQQRSVNDEREITLPSGSYQPNLHRWERLPHYQTYLKSRRFNIHQLINDWDIYFGGIVGEWKWRIICPIYHNSKLVSYVGRGISNKQEPKYLNLHGANLKNYLYGYDHCREGSVIVVEGITDVWRLGRGNAVATFGTQHTISQIQLLKKFRKVGVMFDREDKAQEEAQKIVNYLTLVGVEAEILHLPKGEEEVHDPADLSDNTAYSLVKKFKLNL